MLNDDEANNSYVFNADDRVNRDNLFTHCIKEERIFLLFVVFIIILWLFGVF